MTSEYLAMQSLVQRLGNDHRWHLGDMGWSYHSITGAAEGRRIKVWEDGGEVVAFAWLDLPGHVDLLVDPARPEYAAEALAWSDTEAREGKRTATALETETHLIAAFEAAGYRETDAPFFTHHHHDLAHIDEPVLPQGFRVRHVERDEVEARAGVHRGSWSDLAPSRVTAESYAAVMNAWPYAPEFDWVVETDGGEMVASSLGWFDEVNRTGLLEPVGCVPAYRRMGLSRACNLAVLKAFRDAGAVEARVCPRGDDGYPIPGKLYRAIGFVPGARTRTYARP
ncbi:hypothetical protein [Phytomonospora endophytica]|uniref:N-acetyltransferase domain-containing protein n=1 Tax=Phytomonospora endophytica TaxID=714109 RepID=A0A841FMT3_9ACTN|nr:hypothetical protein [Phytomonospora endophytica]MBB6035108.1 hypothetical protein [Phytomonospora endophytica]GIG64144.1 N-acetyltransferase [Phytomonospora endophytica]